MSSNTNSAAQDASTTHLQNQNYNICIRRAKGYCYICYADWYTTATVGSFGLSVSADDGAAQAGTGTRCSLDYISVRQSFTGPKFWLSKECNNYLVK